MKTFLLPFILVLIATPCAVYGQVTIEKIRNGKGHSFHHYLAVPPGNVQGILLLLPGLGEKPGAVLQKTNLPILAAEIGFLTIIPDLGKNIIADKEITTGLSGLINVYAIKYDLRELRLVVGGFSRGGSISIRYAEHLVASNSPIKLKGVFAIDPALDLNPQVVAASLASENKSLAHPASVDTIPTSANREDHVSMGVTAARHAERVVANTAKVLGIELLCAAQGLDLAEKRLRPGVGVAAAHKVVRGKVAALDGDRFLAPDLAAAEVLVRDGSLVAAVERKVGALAV